VLEELDVLHLGDGLFLGGRDVHQFLDRASLEEVFLDEVGDVLDLELLVENAFGVDHQDGTPFAEPVAARGDDQDLILEVPFPNLLFQGLLDLEGSAGNAPGTGAHE
jgi:hypothetical protein